jgi:uncharacterized membrane protein YphA (DoxX/SURF4 family)
MTVPSARTYAGWLAIVRILTGVLWLIHGIPKFTNATAFMPPNGMIVTYVQRGLANARSPYHDFLATVVQPNISLFAELVRLGEVVAGLLLVLGLFTRLGGLIGIILPLNYLAARAGLGSASQWASADGSMLLLSAISLVLPTGRALGIDALFAPRRERKTVIVPEVVPERPLDGPSAPRP